MLKEDGVSLEETIATLLRQREWHEISFVVFPEEGCVKNAAQRAKGLDNINNFLISCHIQFLRMHLGGYRALP